MENQENTLQNRPVLVLGCSDRKIRQNGFLPAYVRYDGPVWRTYRAALRTLPADVWPATLVLSAQFGVMRDTREIPWYSRRLDAVRAAELVADRGQVAALERYLDVAGAAEIFLCAGVEYRGLFLALLAKTRHAGRKVTIAADAPGAGIGDQMAALKDWLAQRAPAPALRVVAQIHSDICRSFRVVTSSGASPGTLYRTNFKWRWSPNIAGHRRGGQHMTADRALRHWFRADQVRAILAKIDELERALADEAGR